MAGNDRLRANLKPEHLKAIWEGQKALTERRLALKFTPQEDREHSENELRDVNFHLRQLEHNGAAAS